MWTAKRTVGRLLETRLTSSDAGEIPATLAAISEIIARAETSLVSIVDLSQVSIFAQEDVDLVTSVMRRGHARIERSAILLSGDTLQQMQLNRLIQRGELPQRRLFQSMAACLGWLAGSLTSAELDQARRFLNESG